MRSVSASGARRVLHIGFHKTGTTAVQEALRASRRQLRSQGVCYPGQGRNQGDAALAVTGLTYGWRDGGSGRDLAHWRALVEEVATTSADRVIISSEHFEQADERVVRQITDELSPTTVVATLRPMAKILPSSWQQYVKNGLRLSYSEWLTAVLAEPPDVKVTPNFWLRHDHATILGRWCDALGAHSVAVVLADERRPEQLYTSFERLLDLPEGLLAAAAVADDNRSLTAAEAELVLTLNRRLRGKKLSWEAYEAIVKTAIAQRMATERPAGPAEQRITTPMWAQRRAAEIDGVTAERLTRLGVVVHGDLSTLPSQPREVGADEPRPGELMLPVSAAVEAVLGALSDSRLIGQTATLPRSRDLDHVLEVARDPRRAWRAVVRLARRAR